LDFNKNIIFASFLCCLFYTRSGFSLLFGASQWLQGSKLFYFSAVSDKDSWTPSPSNPSSDPASRFFSALNLSPAQLFPEIFLLRTGDRALVRFSCCLCLGLSRFCATAWLWCHFSDSILPPVGLVSSAGRYFFLSPPGSLRSVRRASSTTVFPLIVFDQEHAGRVRFGRWSPVRFWVVTAQDRTEIFQRLFGLHAIDFSLPVLAFCRRAWSRR
jgi:hypothetical protein